MALASKIYDVAISEGLDLLHVHYAIPHCASAVLVKQMLKRTTGNKFSIVTTLHGTDSYLVGMEPSYRSIVQHCLEECDGVTAVSEHLKKETLQNFQLHRDVQVIYNFVNTNIFAPDDGAGPSNMTSGRTVIHVSNFRSLKRVGDTLRVFELITRALPCNLMMIGDGPEKSAAEDLAQQMGFGENISFVGQAGDVRAMIARADLLISTSEIESFGLAIAEAMAEAVPVVATRVGGVPEVVLDGETGFLCELGDIAGLACAALRVLSDGELGGRLGHNGRERVKRHFSPSVIVPQYEELYRRLLHDNSSE